MTELDLLSRFKVAAEKQRIGEWLVPDVDQSVILIFQTSYARKSDWKIVLFFAVEDTYPVSNANFVTWGLDHLERKGWRVRLERYHLTDETFPFYVSWRRQQEEPNWGDHALDDGGHYSFAESRATAVLRALVGILEAEVAGKEFVIVPGTPKGAKR